MKGFAVDVRRVAKMRLLGWEEFCRQGPEAYKPAYIKCKELLSLGGRTVIEYDCFSAEMMHKKDKVEMVMKNELENGIDK